MELFLKEILAEQQGIVKFPPLPPEYHDVKFDSTVSRCSETQDLSKTITKILKSIPAIMYKKG